MELPTGSGGNTSGRNNGEVQYVCNTFGGGPDDFNRYVQIYQGDWFGLINQGDTIATVQGKIGSNNGPGCDASDVRILNQNNVRPGDILTPNDFKQSPLCNLKPGDEEFLTYVVYQRTTTDRNQTQAQVRMKSSWKWDCSPSPDNPFFPMQAEYSVWNNFANAELLAFQSTEFGTVEQGLAEARFNYTIDNLCNVEGEVRKLDRQLCARTCDDSQDEDWNCPAVGVSGSPKPLVQCVAGGIAVETCSTTTPRVTLPPNGSRKITDNYGDIPVYPDYEFQVQLLGTKVKFGTDDMMKSKAMVKEVFEFCALETGGSGGGGISGDGPNPPSPGPNPGGPGRKFALCGYISCLFSLHSFFPFLTRPFVSITSHRIASHRIASHRINRSFPALQKQNVKNLEFRRRRLWAAQLIAPAQTRVGVKMERTGTLRAATSGTRMPWARTSSDIVQDRAKNAKRRAECVSRPVSSLQSDPSLPCCMPISLLCSSHWP